MRAGNYGARYIKRLGLARSLFPRGGILGFCRSLRRKRRGYEARAHSTRIVPRVAFHGDELLSALCSLVRSLARSSARERERYAPWHEFTCTGTHAARECSIAKGTLCVLSPHSSTLRNRSAHIMRLPYEPLTRHKTFLFLKQGRASLHTSLNLHDISLGWFHFWLLKDPLGKIERFT